MSATQVYGIKNSVVFSLNRHGKQFGKSVIVSASGKHFCKLSKNLQLFISTQCYTDKDNSRRENAFFSYAIVPGNVVIKSYI